MSKFNKLFSFKFETYHFVLLFILILGTFLRLYRLPEMASFDFDQEYAANFAYSVVKIYPLQLIGQGLSIQGLFMGPLYFYFLVPFYFLAGLHPLGGAFGSVILGLITILAYYYCLKNVFGVKAGLIGALLRSILTAKIAADWAVTPAFSADLVALLTWFCFYKFWNGEQKYLIGIGFLFGLYTSFHPILFPFYFVFLILLLLKRKLPSFKILITGIVAFIVPILPLIVFEYLHNFLEIKQFLAFSSLSKGTLNLIKLHDLLSASFKDIFVSLGLNFPFDAYKTVIILVSVFAFLIYKKHGFWKNSFHRIILPLTFLIFLIYYFLLPSHSPEYYFLGVTTFVLVYFIASISLLKNYVLITILIILLLSNVSVLYQKWNNPGLSTLYHKDAVVKKILESQPKNEEFFVSYISLPGWQTGFNYLFKLYDQVPQTKEARPPVYTIVTPKGLIEDKFDFETGNIRLILPR